MAVLLVTAAASTEVRAPGGSGGGQCAAREEALRLLALGDDGHPGEMIGKIINAFQTCGGADGDLLSALGSVVYDRGDSSGALRCWRAAWRLSPLSVALANNVAAALIDLARPTDAIATLRSLEHRHVRAQGTAGQVHAARGGDSWKTDINMASALAEVTLLAASARRLERALAHPALAKTAHPQRPVAVANLVFTRRRLCEWKTWEEDATMAADLMLQQMHGVFDFMLPGLLPIDPFMALTFLSSSSVFRAHRVSGHELFQIGAQDVLAVTKKYAAAWKLPQSFREVEEGGWAVGARRGKVAVGYVCSEFGQRHSVMLLMRAVFARHDRRAFHILCFSTRPLPRSSHGSGSRAGGGRGDDYGQMPEGCAESVELGGGRG